MLEEESCNNCEEKLAYVALVSQKDWGLPVMSRLREVKTILW